MKAIRCLVAACRLRPDGTATPSRVLSETACAGALPRCPRSVQVRGGAYFFMPGIAALRYLSRRTS